MRICLHRKKKLGRNGEMKICLKCKRAWEDTEMMAMSTILAPYTGQPVFTAEEKELLRKLHSEMQMR